MIKIRLRNLTEAKIIRILKINSEIVIHFIQYKANLDFLDKLDFLFYLFGFDLISLNGDLIKVSKNMDMASTL